MRLSLSSTQTDAAREACPRRGATAAARQYLKWDGEVGSCGEPPTHRGGAAARRRDGRRRRRATELEARPSAAELEVPEPSP